MLFTALKFPPVVNMLKLNTLLQQSVSSCPVKVVNKDQISLSHETLSSAASSGTHTLTAGVHSNRIQAL